MFIKFWQEWVVEFTVFLKALWDYLKAHLRSWFGGFEFGKGVVVEKIYRQRGKYAGVFTHAGMVVLGFMALTFGPVVLSGTDSQAAAVRKSFGSGTQQAIALADESVGTGGQGIGAVLGATVDVSPLTVESDKPRSEVLNYTVQPGDTLDKIAKQFGVSMDTIRWANDSITSVNSIKPKQVIKIPPVSGIVYTVKSGDTIYSISKKYNADAQSIVDYPFNSFADDETFALSIGQQIIVPDGVQPAEQPWSASSNIARISTPNAGAVSATGSWIWPAKGTITQPYRAWHRGMDIANREGGAILAADAGTIVEAGWDTSGYGNKIVIDHGNGYRTLYAHLLTGSTRVSVGQTVHRGDVIGMMGSTGRSTGTHLHFEIRTGGVGGNPLSYLK